jgi:hypothetical protein
MRGRCVRDARRALCGVGGPGREDRSIERVNSTPSTPFGSFLHLTSDLSHTHTLARAPSSCQPLHTLQPLHQHARTRTSEKKKEMTDALDAAEAGTTPGAAPPTSTATASKPGRFKSVAHMVMAMKRFEGERDAGDQGGARARVVGEKFEGGTKKKKKKKKRKAPPRAPSAWGRLGASEMPCPAPPGREPGGLLSTLSAKVGRDVRVCRTVRERVVLSLGAPRTLGLLGGDTHHFFFFPQGKTLSSPLSPLSPPFPSRPQPDLHVRQTPGLPTPPGRGRRRRRRLRSRHGRRRHPAARLGRGH